MLYQDEVRNVLWSLPESKLDQVIQSFKIGDSKSYLSFFHWQQVYAAVHTELTEELIAATISYLTYTHMTAATLPPDYMDKLNSELAELSSALEARIPEFSMQLQVVLARLQEQPEAAWALPDDQLKLIAEAFKQQRDVVVFAATKSKPKTIRGPISSDDV